MAAVGYGYVPWTYSKPSNALNRASGLSGYRGASAMMSHFKAMSVVVIPVSVGMEGPKGKFRMGIDNPPVRPLSPPLGRAMLPITTISSWFFVGWGRSRGGASRKAHDGTVCEYPIDEAVI